MSIMLVKDYNYTENLIKFNSSVNSYRFKEADKIKLSYSKCCLSIESFYVSISLPLLTIRNSPKSPCNPLIIFYTSVLFYFIAT